jgi:sec-independent protein translocase protein TatC
MKATPQGGRMPLMAHLRELRRRIFLSSFVILLGSVVGFYFYQPIIDLLAKPVCDLNSGSSEFGTNCGALTINGILGPLNLQLKVAILSGILITAPFWLYQLWAFIAPALHRREKRKALGFIFAATPFFFAGAYLGYITLPVAVKFLLGLTPETLVNLVSFESYLEFVLRIILVFALAFELPVFLVTFNLIGFLSGKTILRPWRGWIFGICLFVASFSPSSDPISLLTLALPLISFYFLAGGFAVFNDRRRAKRVDGYINDDGAISPASPIDPASPLDPDNDN